MKTLKKTAAFTVAELIVSAGVGVLAMAAAFSGAITIQRCFVAAEEYAADKSEQTRLSDYLALDLRRALTITGPVDNTLLTLTIANYYDAGGDPKTPEIVKTPEGTYVARYDTTPVTVVYRKHKAIITRTEGAGNPVIIATNVEDFECPVDGIGADNFVHTRVNFLPSFQHSGTPSAATRTATTVYNTIRLRNKP